MKDFFYRHRFLWLILAAAFLLRLGVALPGLLTAPAERFARPDTAGYLVPARMLAETGRYAESSGGPPAVDRVPGFPLLAAAVFRAGGGEGALALGLLFLGTLAIIPIYLAAKELKSKKTGLLAALLAALNLTAIANAPMLLSDTLFFLTAAWQFYFFCRFWRSREAKYFLLSILLASLGMLIRPINSAWLLPALFLLAVLPGVSRRKKLATGGAAAAIFLLLPLPWMLRNQAVGTGFTLDANTGAMVWQNGAMLTAAATGGDFETEKAKILARLDEEFRDKTKYPDRASQVRFQLDWFKAMIKEHPFLWFRQHLQPRVLLPDAPTFCELLGATTAGRGTMGVLEREGVWAAVQYYFDGKLWLPLVLLPLLIPTVVTYMGVAAALWRWVRRWRRYWYAFFVFLAFAEYYYFLPGPITAPRYQLPTLPILTAMAAVAALTLWRYLKKRRHKIPIPTRT